MGGDALYRKVPEVFHAATLTMAAIMALGVVQEAQATAPDHRAEIGFQHEYQPYSVSQSVSHTVRERPTAPASLTQCCS